MCANEINFRVVLYGAPNVGKSATLMSIYAGRPANQQGRLVIIESQAEKTVVLEFSEPEFGDCNGRSVRLQLCALHGDVNYEASSQLILKNVDAIVFVADAQRDRQEANRRWAELLKDHLAQQGRSADHIPMCIAITQLTLANAAEAATVVRWLDLPEAPTFHIDPTTGSNIGAMLTTVVAALKDGIAAGTVSGTIDEGITLADGVAGGQEFLAREGLVSHYRTKLGNDARILKPNSIAANRPGFLVVELRPTANRPYYTYATAGLSLWAQTPSGTQPRLEIFAYSSTEDDRIATVLSVIGKQIQGLTEGDAAFHTLDTLDLTGLGLIHDWYVFAPPLESDQLLKFPAPADRMLDVWFTESLGGHQDDATPDPVFVHLVPVTEDELQFAKAKGTPTLLKKMNHAKRGKTIGWSRGPAESSLNSRFRGRF